jgi:hypothetical protein
MRLSRIAPMKHARIWMGRMRRAGIVRGVQWKRPNVKQHKHA